MSCGWLFWDKGKSILYTAEGSTKEAIEATKSPINISLPKNEIYTINCLKGKTWQLSIEQAGKTTIYISSNGIKWDFVPMPPFVGKKYDNIFGFIPDFDIVFNVESEQKLLHLYHPELGWKKKILPDGAQYCTINNKGTFWAIGGKKTDKIKNHETEVAAWVQKDNEDWQELPIRSSWWHTFKTIDNGGYHELIGLNVDYQPKVFISECAWFFDEQTFFIFTLLPSGRFNIQRFKDRRINRFDKDINGNLIILTCDGEQLHWNGKKWISKGIGDTIRKFLDCPSYYYKSLNYKANLVFFDNEYYGLISNGISEGKYADCDILIKSKNSGISWEIIDSFDKEKDPIKPISVWLK